MDRIKRVKRGLRHRKLDALLVTQPQNRRYLSGFTAGDMNINESAGALLIPRRGRPVLMTDFRYQLEAEAEAKGFAVTIYRQGLFALLKKILAAGDIKKLGFESHYFLHRDAARLAALTEKIGVEPVPTVGMVEGMRLCKDPAEIEKIRAAVLLNERVFQQVFRELKSGMTERRVAVAIETLMRQEGAEGPSFETIVAGGPNGAKPHAVPSERPLRTGEPVVIDMGLILDGYCSDMTRTVVLGAPDGRTRDIFRLVRRAQQEGIEAIRAGVTGAEVDRAARRIISEAGYGKQFGHALGHGVGLAVHEGPGLSRRYKKKLKAGMVVTVEPGIYLPGWGGVRLENMVAVTERGCEVLNLDQTFPDL